MLIKIFLFFSIIFSSFTVGESLYEFDSIEDEKRFYTLIKKLGVQNAQAALWPAQMHRFLKI